MKSKEDIQRERDELNKAIERGKYSDEPDIECSLLCTGLIEELS